MNLNFAGKWAKIFVENTALSWLLVVGIVFSGIFGYVMMPKQYNPEVTLPAFVVITEYPGATATQVHDFVTREMEEKIAEIPRVDTIASQSIDGGKSIVRVQFLVGEDLENAKVKLFSKIQENMDFKAGNILTPMIKNITPDDVPVFGMVFSSEKFSQNQLRQKVLLWAEKFQKIEGIANVEVLGGERRALKIVLDREVMKNRNISFPEVVNALQKNNGRAKVGHVKTHQSLHEIEVDGGIVNAEEARKILLFPGVFLGDIATVNDDFAEKISSVRFVAKNQNIQDAVFFSVAKRKGENTSVVVSAAENLVQQMQSDGEFLDITFEKIRDDNAVAKEAINGLGSNLLQSIAIVALVLFFFLGGRSAFLVALAIPLTLLFVFFFGFLFDQTINRITLFALILSLGLLVDSATVVVENIHRHIHMADERSLVQKISEAVSEVGIGLLLSTITSVIVFLPLTQITGMMGPYMAPLAFFVPAALLVSLFVAYIITPFVSSLVFHLEKNDEKENAEKNHTHQKISAFDRFTEKYGVMLEKIFDSPKLQKTILISVFGALFAFFIFVPLELVHFRMLPKSDQDQFWITLDLPEGTNFPKTQEVTEKMMEKISVLPEISSVEMFVGTPPLIDFNGLFRGFSFRSDPHQSSVKVHLEENRDISSEKVAEKVRNLMNEHFLVENSVENIVFRVVEEPPGPPVEATLVAKIKSENEEARKNVGQMMQKILGEIEKVVDIDTTFEKPYPKTIFSIDTQKAEMLGISAKDIFDSIQLATEPKIVGEFHPENMSEMAFVEISLLPSQRQNPDDFSNIFLKNSAGEMVPLSAVMEKISSEHTPKIIKDKHETEDEISAEMGDRSVIYAVRDIIFSVFDVYRVEKFSLFGMTVVDAQTQELVKIEWGGEFKMTLENFRDLGIAMMVAFFLVYAVLVAQFQSFKIPLLIMATIPLAMVGILPGFAILDALNGTYLTATALIGFIALMGIVVNNAILFLEYLDIVKSTGISLQKALVEAGKTRMRPILLTSLTTVLGSLTIASDPVWSGLAWSIVFGLSLSAILTLVIFPILYFRSVKNVNLVENCCHH